MFIPFITYFGIPIFCTFYMLYEFVWKDRIFLYEFYFKKKYPQKTKKVIESDPDHTIVNITVVCETGQTLINYQTQKSIL